MANSAPYQVTEADALWLARAVAGEGRPERWVAQALVNRFMWLRCRKPRDLYPRLSTFVCAYAQPVNPRWMRGGARWDRAYNLADTAGRRRLEAAHDRRQKHRQRTEFPGEVLEAVRAALCEGIVDLPRPTVTDYAAHTVVGHDGLELVTEGRRGLNQFYAPRHHQNWPGYRPQAVDLSTPLDRVALDDDGVRFSVGGYLQLVEDAPRAPALG